MTRRFSFVLPDRWWRIPLINKQARTANIDHVVDSQFPNIDEAAALRHDIKTELQKVADQAVRAGGIVMAIYLQHIEEVPITATMTCYDISGKLALPEQIDPAKLLAMYVGDKELEDSLPDLEEMLFPDRIRTESDEAPDSAEETGGTSASGDRTGETPPAEDQQSYITEAGPQEADTPSLAAQTPPQGGDHTDESEEPRPVWTKVTSFNVLAYRQEKITPGTDYFGPGAPLIPQLQVTYAQIVKNFGLVQTVFSTPVIPARDAWVPMFDAMIAAFRTGAPDADTTETTDSKEV
ncbi:MAG: hypothetical protein FWF25_00095 [Propionibacteriaceae bacterium]|nr:hypothetical protein [Propionibacteriaceae bacterium]